MSKPVFKDPFSFDTRRNRKSFILFYVLAFITMGFLVVPFLLVTNYAFSFGANPILQFIVIFIFYGLFGLAWFVFSVAALCYDFQRCNDIGISRLWAVAFFGITFSIQGDMGFVASGLAPNGTEWAIYTLAVITFIFWLGFCLYLACKKGEEKKNQFGANPLNVEWGDSEAKKTKKV